MTFRVRAATRGDVDAIARVHVRSWQTSYRGILPDAYLDAITVDARAERRERVFLKPDILQLVGCDVEGRVVAFCDAGPQRRPETPSAAELYAIYLLDEARRAGLGRRLFEEAVAWLRVRQRTSLTVSVFEANAPARRFYEAMGGILGERGTVAIDGVDYPEVAYAWATL